MKSNYGNSFNTATASGDAKRLSAWVEVTQLYPVGAYLKPNEGGYAVGQHIPLGTPVKIDEVGGEVTFPTSGSDVTGLTLENSIMGTDGCTITIVTGGILNKSLLEKEVPATIETALSGRILFTKENGGE